MSATTSIKVAVVEDHEIFRRGLLACLAEDPGITVTTPPPGAAPRSFDEAMQDAGVAVVCGAAARLLRFACPLVGCTAERDEPLRVADGNINHLEHRLCARTRAHVVAHAARQGLI